MSREERGQLCPRGQLEFRLQPVLAPGQTKVRTPSRGLGSPRSAHWEARVSAISTPVTVHRHTSSIAAFLLAGCGGNTEFAAKARRVSTWMERHALKATGAGGRTSWCRLPGRPSAQDRAELDLGTAARGLGVSARLRPGTIVWFRLRVVTVSRSGPAVEINASLHGRT